MHLKSLVRHPCPVLRAPARASLYGVQGACLRDDCAMLVTEYCEGGNLARNILAHKVSWYRRGRKVRRPRASSAVVGGACSHGGRLVCELSLFVALGLGWAAGCGQGEILLGACMSQRLTAMLPAGHLPALLPCPQIAIDIAKGLVFLHSRRIVHLDLKSPNILLAR